MVGVNCSISGCSSSRRISVVAIFKVSQGDEEWSSNWRKSIISIVTKDRVIDKALREKIMKKNIFACEIIDRNNRDLLGYTEKNLLLKDLTTMFCSMRKISNFYWFCFIAFPLRNNEEFKII